ncbi:polysaccharide pyruvyl transferase family protein [Paenibacillus odorifer]|uniref:Polysaccharide pyruvyl transferase domain-containing protein n=1 Tax=Paenibacillus odorifer TaxID=189426 RepID=A0A1R0Y9N8_9BACL|nr:polysaccharide pyruvyl transferase family protein [Paenibacillus odorifer]OMD44115.1 hypothetical protein BSK52_00820 [Paenibacillus odorifer]
MKKMLIYAYTEFNLGDDLFIKVLCERYPDTQFRICAPSLYKQCFKEIKNLKVYPSDSLFLRGVAFICRRLKIHNLAQKYMADRSDGVVHIGGSIFMQAEHWEEHFKNAEAIRNKNKPYYLLGSNFGPYTDKEYYEEHRRIFKDYTDICFREKYSYELFEDLDHVRLAPDIIFQLNPPDLQPEPEDYIVLSVIKPSSKGLNGFDNLYYEKMKELAIYFIEKGYAVHFMSFCEHEGDQLAIEEIRNLMGSSYEDAIQVHLYKTNMEEVLAVLANSSFIVASRFHAMILGWVLDKPVFPVAYSQKMINVMEDAQYKGLYTDFTTLEQLQPAQVFDSMTTHYMDVTPQAKHAERHFEHLDTYLSLYERRIRYESQAEHS